MFTKFMVVFFFLCGLLKINNMSEGRIFKCRMKNDELIDEFYCCMLCKAEAEYMVECWEYNMVLVNNVWVSRWEND